MPTALIADDEDGPRAQLAAALHTAWPDLLQLGECASGVDAWDAFLEHEPDVCFLDVRMPGLTGIEVAQRIGSRARIVFISGSGDHALAAFEAARVDCVIKPVDATRLAPVIARVRARLADPRSAAVDLQPLLNRLAGQVRKPAPLDAILAGGGGGGGGVGSGSGSGVGGAAGIGGGAELRSVPVDAVAYFEAEGRHTRVVCIGAEPEEALLLRTPLKELVAQLDPAAFWQVHRTLIVNRQLIADSARADDGSMTLALRGRAGRLPVARHFQGLFQGLVDGA